DSIADDRHHVSIVGDVRFVAHTPASRNDNRAPLLVLAGHGDIEHAVQAFDDTRDAAALRRIEARISAGIEDRACADDVGTPEERYGVAIAVRGVDVYELHGLAV